MAGWEDGGRAPFITLEGGEGVGKSTQARWLARRIEAMNLEVLTTLEPGATELGGNLRRLVSERRSEPPSSLAELCLYLADRADHVEKQIAPALMRGCLVICDRFTDSSEVYQGRGRDLGFDKVRELNRWVCGEIWPDLTLLLDLNPQTGLKRVLERQGSLGLDRMESEQMAFHEDVRQGFLDLAAMEPGRIKVIEADQPAGQVAEDIWSQVEPLVTKWIKHAA
jgi:dTMP kinase